MRSKKNFLMIVFFLISFGCLTACSKAKSVDNQNTIKETEQTQSVEKDNVDKEIKDVSWAKEAVFYQIFVRSFYDGNGDGIGDFKGITQKVAYLKELGVNAIWLMPMMESTTYHGYDVVDYYSVEKDYGTMEDFKEMIDTCHDNDIKVIIDFVVNHSSNQNQWFLDAVSNKDSKYRNYYEISDEIPKESDGWRKDNKTGEFYYAFYDSIMPDLNYKNQEVRDEIKNVASFWMDEGVDGFRLDGSKNIDIKDPTITHSWWTEFTSFVKDKNPSAFIVGENWNGTMKDIAPFYTDMYSSFNFPLQKVIENMAGGANQDVISVLNDGYKLYEEAAKSSNGLIEYPIDSTMLGNHDMDRIASKVGSIEKAKLSASILFTLPGTPFIYYGDELGQLGQKPDPNIREPFDWYASTAGEGMTVMNQMMFNKSVYTKANDGISYEEEISDSNSILNHYKKLISIRESNKMLFNGKYETIGMEDGLYAYSISEEGTDYKLLIVHNQSETDKTFALKVTGTDLYTDTEVVATDSYPLKAYNTLIFKYTSDELPVDKEDFEYTAPAEYSVTFKVTLPENTPMDEKIYLVGDFNSWNECDENYIMERTSQTTCEITIHAMASSKIEYKFTRGSWEKREQNAKGADLVGPLQKENRYYTFEKDGKAEECVIEKWSDIK